MQIDFAQHLSGSACEDAIFECVRRFGAVPIHACHSLRRFHFSGKLIDEFAGGAFHHILIVFNLFGVAGQRSDVLFNVGAEQVFVEVTHEVEGEVGSVGSALFSNFEHAVVVHIFQFFHAEGSITPALIIDGVVHLFLEHGFGLQILVLQCSFKHLHDAVEILFVLAHGSHLQVSELEECFQILYGRLAFEAFVIIRER